MFKGTNSWLLIGAACSGLVALLHVAIIVMGPEWYRYFGAPSLADQIEHGAWLAPTGLTLLVAIIFFVWAAYALSGIGLIRRLPLLRVALVAIGSIYVLRGLLLFQDLSALVDGRLHSPRFAVFSAFSLLAGIFYLVGAARFWKANSRVTHP